MSQQSLAGSCLCGDVAWQMEGPFDFFGMCQCSLCRKVTGSAFASNLFCSVDKFRWMKGEDHRIIYQMPDPKRFGNAACKTCGSRAPNVFATNGLVLLPLGSTNEDPGIKPTSVCPEDHAEWFTLLTDTPEG